MKNARQLAVRALVKVNETGGYSNLVVDSLLDAGALSAQDAAFATALVYGVLERRITLDYVIGRYSKTPLRKLDSQVREILRMSLYQLLYMDSVPDRAAVNEGVKLTRAMGKTSAGGFVNGVLRAFLRDEKQIIPEGARLPRTERLSVEYATPVWLVQMLCDQYGEEDAIGVLAASLGRPPLYLRANTLRTTAGQLAEELSGAALFTEQDSPENCLRVARSGDLTRLPAFAEGRFHVQDKASQLCVRALDVHPEQAVLDVCAAPGGKSFTAAQYLENRGRLVSRDIYPARVQLLADGAARLGITCLEASVGDASVYDPDLGGFDRVLCDVPCSGLGIIRRKPEIKYKNPDEFAALPDYQYQILCASAGYLKPEGVLVYSTCTLNKAENEQVIERFLREHGDFAPCPLAAIGLPEQYYTTLLPHRGGSDGFFISAVRRVQ